MYKKYIKRMIDILFSAAGLLVLLIPFVIIMIAIKLDSKGPVFFRQKRLGYKGQVFEILKFRTMVDGAESMGDGIFLKSEEDQRITAVGKFLRRTSLDELPQLVNILKGEMSLIGPRPPLPNFPHDGYAQYSKINKQRFEVKPGITGLAQIKFRNSVAWSERFVLDIEYVHNLTFLTDLKIVFETFFAVFSKKNIYVDDHKKK